MKKFQYDDSYVNITQAPNIDTQERSNSFNLPQLLQTLRKLNLGSLFSSQNSQPTYSQNSPTYQNITRSINYKNTQKQIDTHIATVQKIRK